MPIEVQYPQPDPILTNHATILDSHRAELERLAAAQATVDKTVTEYRTDLNDLILRVDRRYVLLPNTQDGAAIQLMLDVAEVQGGGHVHLPYGTYVCEATLRIGSNTRLTGDGAVVVMAPDAVPDPYMLLGNKGKSAQNIHVSGITFDGGNIAPHAKHPGIGNSHLLSFAGVVGLTLERVTILRALRYSLLFNSGSYARIRHCRIISADGTPGIYQRDGFHILNSSDVDVFDCEATTQDDAFVCRVVAGYTSRNVRFRSCRAKSGVYGYRLVLADGKIEDADITECTAYDCGHGGVQVIPWKDTPGGTVAGVLVRNTIIRRCPKLVDVPPALATGVRVVGTEIF